MQDAFQRRVHFEFVGHARERTGEHFQVFERHGRLAAARTGAGAAEAGPAAGEPIGACRAVAFRGLVFELQLRLDVCHHLLGVGVFQHPFGRKAFCIELPHRRVGGDLAIHHWLGERRLIGLVVAEAAIAEEIDHYVAAELVAEVGGDLGDVRHRLGVVAVHVENGRLDAGGDVGRIG